MNNPIVFRDGTAMPRLGQGAWYMGEHKERRAQELEALHQGITLGMTLLDTAEMYGQGASEKLLGEVLKKHPRESLFLTSKVYPHNAGREHIFTACKNSLQRLDQDYLDLYLLHWRGAVPLAETIECMEELKKEGLIKHWGVSNFDLQDMRELLSLPKGNLCAVNQVLYHLGSRGVEYDLLPYLQKQGIALMAYCPLGHDLNTRKALGKHPLVQSLLQTLDMTLEQLMLAFLLSKDNVCAIPKASSPEHVRQNAATLHRTLEKHHLDLLDEAFPAPKKKMPLDML